MRRASRTSLALTAALTLVFQLAGVAHDALVRHTVCAEHGEWVDAGPAPKQSAEATPDSPALALADTTVGHGHEHCAVLAVQRTPTRTGASFVLAPPAVSTPLAVRRGATSRSSVLEPLDVAPKASPPV